MTPAEPVTDWPFDRLMRFWSKVAVRSVDDCWPWVGGRQAKGYGSFGHGPRPGRSYLVHRIAWECVYGPIPDGLTIDHLCLYKPCCNPAHMELVSRSVNAYRGRHLFIRVDGSWRNRHDVLAERTGAVAS